MKQLLVITYYWPPAGGPGVQRWLKFAKYLNHFHWKPVILTVSDGTFPAMDASLENDVPENVVVYRTKAGGPFKWYNMLKRQKGNKVPVALIGMNNKRSWFDKFALYVRSNLYIPDARKGWNKFALKCVPEIIKTHNISAVITTGPPHSTHLIGKIVAERYSLPWIADFRDPWTTVYYNELMPRSKRTKRVDKALENLVLSKADVILTVGHGMVREFQARTKKIVAIYNGFDVADMTVTNNIAVQYKGFVILHTGNLAPNQHVAALWNAIAQLCNEEDGFADDLKIRLVGGVDGDIIKQIVEVALLDKLIIEEYKPHNQALVAMAKASCLLLVIPRSKGNRSIVTGKIFEYLATGVPILGIGPVDGDAAEILNEAGRDSMIDFDDLDRIKNAVLNIYKRWRENNSTTKLLDTTSCEKFSRKNGTAKLAEILDELVKR